MEIDVVPNTAEKLKSFTDERKARLGKREGGKQRKGIGFQRSSFPHHSRILEGEKTLGWPKNETKI